MKIGAIIQARCGSERFPRKVLMGLPMSRGRSVLAHIFRRVAASSQIDSCVVATSVDPANDAIEEAFPGQVFRGDEEDVLKRMYECAKESGFETIVRLTGDNPCIDFSHLDEMISSHVEEKADYTVTSGLPLGMNAEVVSFAALEAAHQEAEDSYEREHVTPFIARRPERFLMRRVEMLAPKNTKELRLTMDYPSDYALLNLLFDHFDEKIFSLAELSEFVEEHPWIGSINPNHQKRDYPSEKEELEAAISLLKKAELHRAADRLSS
ncbi:glycosyltransferase family protein [Akkermansiaceae bacterium]|nr:glycosyltransferase family protein [Akkermansiaceae bacterium]